MGALGDAKAPHFVRRPELFGEERIWGSVRQAGCPKEKPGDFASGRREKPDNPSHDNVAAPGTGALQGLGKTRRAWPPKNHRTLPGRGCRTRSASSAMPTLESDSISACRRRAAAGDSRAPGQCANFGLCGRRMRPHPASDGLLALGGPCSPSPRPSPAGEGKLSSGSRIFAWEPNSGIRRAQFPFRNSRSGPVAVEWRGGPGAGPYQCTV